MGVKVGGRLSTARYNKRAELLGDYYYYEFSGPLENGQAYADAALADGFTGGSVSCSQEFFNVLKNIA